jgi:hypothetical protein
MDTAEQARAAVSFSRRGPSLAPTRGRRPLLPQQSRPAPQGHRLGSSSSAGSLRWRQQQLRPGGGNRSRCRGALDSRRRSSAALASHRCFSSAPRSPCEAGPAHPPRRRRRSRNAFEERGDILLHLLSPQRQTASDFCICYWREILRCTVPTRKAKLDLPLLLDSVSCVLHSSPFPFIFLHCFSNIMYYYSIWTLIYKKKNMDITAL